MEKIALETPPVVSGALPLIGHLTEFGKNRAGLIQRGYEEHGCVFTVKLGPQNVAVLLGPEHHRTFFMETDKTLNIATPYKFLRATFGEVFFMAGHEEYLRQRPFLTQAFRREKMAHYIEIMNRRVQAWLDSLGEAGEFDISETMGWLTQDIAGHALMGERFQTEAGPEFWELYADVGRGMDPIPPGRRCRKFSCPSSKNGGPILKLTTTSCKTSSTRATATAASRLRMRCCSTSCWA